MSKNVAVFVDVANIFYAAKAAGVDIDYVTLLKASSAGRDLVRAYAYTGLDPDNENQRNFHEFLRRHGYKVVSKDIRKYGDGKVKANLDIELVVDMMKTARNLDIAIVISGDGDFAPAIRAVQEMGVRVEVVSFRGNTSSDLIDVADQFTDITQIAKVEKGSSRSGRRVADDDEDLSMTEVPDKLFEGTGEPRRGRGRGRTTRTATETTTPTGRTRRAPAAPRVAAAAAAVGDVPLVVLPGEKLSRVAAAPLARDSDDETEDLIAAEIGDVDVDADEAAEGGAAGFESAEDGARRRRRRRGGRGRGRGRREEGAPEGAGDAPAEAGDAGEAEDDDFEAPVASPRRPAASTFGSVWDSQIGVPAAATGGRKPLAEDDEDLDEPPIPEYLIAERRQRDAARPGRGGVNRGGRGGAYAAAMDRERYGGGRGSTMSRFGDQGGPRRDAPLRRDGGPNRIDRADRPAFRPDNRPAPRPVNSDEPWSEVPPELEAMLRAQLASGGGRARPAGGGTAPVRRPAQAAPTEPAGAMTEADAAPAPARPARRGSRAAAPATATTGDASAGVTADAAAPKRRATRTAKPAAEASSDATPKKAAVRSTAKAATTTRSRAKAAPVADPGPAAGSDGADGAAAAPKRRSRKTPDASA